MKNGKGPAGLIVVTTQGTTMRIWANSHHLCGELATELEELRKTPSKKDKKSKEEKNTRIKADKGDQQKIRVH